MAKRLLDFILASFALVFAAPLIAVAAIGIHLSSAGPVIYRARRVGRGGRIFTLYKLRSMHLNDGSKVTAANDFRVFRWGALLRKTKLDELPQLWNIICGDMSLVGPRPEDPDIVANCYGALGWESLNVRPGLAGVSSLYNYTHGERMLATANGSHFGAADATERIYADQLLPLKLALEAVYLRRHTLAYDARLIVRTATTILQIARGRTEFPDPPEMPEALAILNKDRCQLAA